MAEPLEFDFTDPKFNFPEFFESFNIQPEFDPFSLGSKPKGGPGGATLSEQAFNAAQAVNQNDPTFFQSLLDAGLLRRATDTQQDPIAPFGTAGSARPNFALESALHGGEDDRGLTGLAGGASFGGLGKTTLGEIFKNFDPTFGISRDKKNFGITSAQAGSAGAFLGNVLGTPALGGLGGALGTLAADGSYSEAGVQALLGMLSGAAPPLGFGLSAIEAIFDPFGFDPAAPQTLKPAHFGEPSPIGDPGAYPSVKAWLDHIEEFGLFGGALGDSTQPFDPNATIEGEGPGGEPTGTDIGAGVSGFGSFASARDEAEADTGVPDISFDDFFGGGDDTLDDTTLGGSAGDFEGVDFDRDDDDDESGFDETDTNGWDAGDVE